MVKRNFIYGNSWYDRPVTVQPRLAPTVLATIAGYLLYFLTRYHLVPLGYAVGLMFMDYFLFRRLSYIDPESGFYNEKYPLSVSDCDRRGRTPPDVFLQPFPAGSFGPAILLQYLSRFLVLKAVVRVLKEGL